MNEQEWLTVTDPIRMLAFSLDKVSERKLRWFSCACCRCFCTVVTDERFKQSIEASESYADRLTKVALKEASYALRPVQSMLVGRGQPQTETDVAWALARNVAVLIASDGAFADKATQVLRMTNSGYLGPRTKVLCAFLRDIFGNPFRPVNIDPAWLTWRDATVPKLAQAAYDERELPSGELNGVHLAVLADALEEAGCTNADMVAHLRSPGPHVRGCWVVDLLLGKA